MRYQNLVGNSLLDNIPEIKGCGLFDKYVEVVKKNELLSFQRLKVIFWLPISIKFNAPTTLILNYFLSFAERSEFGSSGIGVAVCKNIMALHDGIIAAEVITGDGTVIKYFFSAKSD